MIDSLPPLPQPKKWLFVVLSLLGCLLPSCGEGAPKNSVVLITIDTTRADRLGCYGYESAQTPTLDALAEGGVLFKDARTSVPITLPAHASIFTGTYPPYHGIRDNAVAALGEGAHTIAEMYADRGYATGAFVSAYVLDRPFGLAQGFDTYDTVPKTQLISGGFLEERSADQTIDSALTWLEGREEPYFMWIHLFDPHAPYAPPAPFDESFKDSPYDGEIAFVDAQLRRLVEAIDERGERERTRFVITSDHGEALSEHGEETHAVFVYDSTLRVPLIMSGPGLPSGVTIDAPVATVDILPTLAELDSLSVQGKTQGLSLLDWIQGEEASTRTIYFESYNGYLHYGWSPLVGMTDGEVKLIESPRPELYEVSSDPQELTDTFTDSSSDDRIQKIRESTKGLWQELQNTAHFAVVREVSNKERATLEALGYLAGESPAGKLPYPSAEMPDPKDKIHIQSDRHRAMYLIDEFRRTGDRGALQTALQTILLPGLNEDPDNSTFHEMAGTVFAYLEDYDSAIHHLRSCIAKRPERLDARFNLGFCLMRFAARQSDPNKAVEMKDAAYTELQTCLSRDPSFVKAAMQLAEWETFYKNYKSALTYWQSFLRYWDAEDEHRQKAEDEIRKLEAMLGN